MEFLKDIDHISFLVNSPGWKVLDKHLSAMESEAIEALIQSESPASRERVRAIRELRNTPARMLEDARKENAPSEEMGE